MQAKTEVIPVSSPVKRELERRKKILSKKTGRKVSFDIVIRRLLGWS
jgi:hypothetical protein